MFTRALQTKNVFACHCEISDHSIKAGLLIVGDRQLAGQRVTLVQSEDPEGDRYLVTLPTLLPLTLHDVELVRA